MVREKKKVRILRGDHKKEFVVILNALAQNRKLSYEARGLLLDLLSRPNDWEVVPAELEIEGCGRHKVARILKELGVKGYMVTEEMRELGRWAGIDYYFFDVPQTGFPHTAKPHADKPQPEDPQQQRTESLESFKKTDSKQKQTQQKLPRVFSKEMVEVLGNEVDFWIALYSYERVQEVCKYSVVCAENPPGFAKRALKCGWQLKWPEEKTIGQSYIDGEYADFIDH